MQGVGGVWGERSGFICRLCRQDAKHNDVLRISYCGVHGLSSPLDALPWRTEVRYPRPASTPAPGIPARPASLAVPA